MSVQIVLQFVIAMSVLYVWTVRYRNLAGEFQSYGYSPAFRNTVGIVKVGAALGLMLALFVPALTAPALLTMLVMMLGAQYTHFKVNSALSKRVPSFALLILCAVLLFQYF